MTPAARAQAAIEILEEVIASARSDGPPADALVTAYFKSRRYAGSGDRRAVRELVFRAVRRSAELPGSGRAAMLGIAPELFDGSPHGPAPPGEDEQPAAASLLPEWLGGELSAKVAAEELAALVERAPLDLRANLLKGDRDALLGGWPDAVPTPLSPWGLRLPADTPVTSHPAYLDGRAEVQDEGSQLVALACEAGGTERIVDLCAGGGGKALAQLPPRAERAGARIATRLLNPPREAAELSDLGGRCDLVLVDAPCSGSGTWRRNPEGRWRLTPERLERLAALQARVLDLAAPLVKPGGRLVYAVCSVLGREGGAQADAFLSRHSGFEAMDIPLAAGRLDRVGRLLTPGVDGTDGFFIARFRARC
jgi:16S rRNA (cytosine967-C5)-methyltransferase